MLREIPSRAWKSSNRRTPKNASRTINRLHHSPTTSRHWATEQFMSSKLVRCTTITVVSCIIERNPLFSGNELPAGSTDRRARSCRPPGSCSTTYETSHVTGWIDLGPEHHQPWGLVHGGVYTTAIESAASVGASTAAQEHGLVAVGVNNNTNFLRSMTEGRVTVDARAIQQGRTQQLWEVRITDDHSRLIATGQVRLQNITPRL